MAGTSVEVTFAIRLIPPIITSPSRTARTAPVNNVLIPKDLYSASEILLIWGRLPVPKEESMVAKAKNPPRMAPVLYDLYLDWLMFIQAFLHIIHRPARYGTIGKDIAVLMRNGYFNKFCTHTKYCSNQHPE